MAMICRDEEVNLRSNLPLWENVVDAFVFMLDQRTIDRSVDAIHEILVPKHIPFIIQNYTFVGFGDARTLSLSVSWQHFYNMSHVLIADPDWRPDPSTVLKRDLDASAQVFRFSIFDRNGITRRYIDWCLLHRAGLAMRYSLHEVLDIGYYSVKKISWQIHEVEQPGSWHHTVGHGHSMSAQRYEHDLHLLYQDLPVFGHSPHLHYYLGITHHALMEGKLKDSRQIDQYDLQQSIRYLELRARSRYSADFSEQRWASMFLLATIFHIYKVRMISTFQHMMEACS
jgi:hypothetical protein